MVMCVKYRRQLIRGKEKIDRLKMILKEIGERYWFEMDELGTDGNHVHVFVGAAPRYAPSKVMQIMKSISARKMFAHFPALRKELWGGEFWSDGGYIGTVGDQANEATIKKYVQEQGDYKEK